jgi:hypothetical protein
MFEFDGENDSIFQEFDRQKKLFMEYLEDGTLMKYHYLICSIITTTLSSQNKESGITLGGVLSHPNYNEKDRAATEEKIYKAFWIY